jgi:protein-S-isoprenylcysteine O-methyltransferase Ste14
LTHSWRVALWILAFAVAAIAIAVFGHPTAITSAEPALALDQFGFPVRMLIALVPWAFLSFFLDTSHRDETRVAESAGSRRLHLFLTGLARMLLFISVPGLGWRFMPLSLPLVVLGLVLECLAVLFTIGARRSLGRQWNDAIATFDGHELVRSGSYRRVRHPVYAGLIGMALATAMVSGELHALLGLAITLVAYGRKIGLEERHLASVFGAEYEAYRATTGSLLPRIG